MSANAGQPPKPCVRGRWRRALRAVACLLLGAVVNVLVAWGCALWAPMTDQLGGERGNAQDIAKRHGLPEDWVSYCEARQYMAYPVQEYLVGVGKSGLVSGLNHEHFAALRFPTADIGSLAVTSGWPWPSMRCSYRWDLRPTELGGPGWSPNNVQASSSALLPMPMWLEPAPVNSFAITSNVGFKPGLPMRILWAPFLASALLYALPLFVVVVAIPEWHRQARISAGRCVRCGYLMDGLPSVSCVCPECGTPRVKRSE